MDTLDGNAIGGLLHEVFGTEMTAAVGTCANCGCEAHYMLMDAAAEALSAPAKATTSSTTAKASA